MQTINRSTALPSSLGGEGLAPFCQNSRGDCHKKSTARRKKGLRRYQRQDDRLKSAQKLGQRQQTARASGGIMSRKSKAPVGVDILSR